MIQALHTDIRGRARFKVRGLYGSERLKEEIHGALSGNEYIRSISASPLTGNVLVLYDPEYSPPAIAALIKEAVRGREDMYGPLDEPPGIPSVPAFLTKILDTGKGRTKRAVRVRRAAGKAGDSGHAPAIHNGDSPDWHLIERSAVLLKLNGRPDAGLTNEAAEELLKKHGPNSLPSPSPRSALSILAGQVNSLPVALLVGAAGISIATGGVLDAIVISAVISINSVIGFVTESQAERTISSLQTLVKPEARVVRGSAELSIGAEKVVPGDMLVLKPGSYVAADARIVKADRLTIDESALTGESMPVVKTTGAHTLKGLPLGERTNMAYMGTLVTGGSGLAVVVATGTGTELSKVHALVHETAQPQTPMQRELSRMGTHLALLSGSICGVVFIIGALRGYGLLGMLKTSISLAVAAVPEGLPTVATTTLALGVSRMKRRKVLIRRLSAVETLGSVETICLDKTGTITHNRMSVISVYITEELSVSDGIFKGEKGAVEPYSCHELLGLMHVAVLCNESTVDKNGDGYTLNGSSTENALMQMALASGVNVKRLKEQYPLLRTNHRAENRNFMSTVHSAPGGRKLVAVKGSPMEVLAICSRRLANGRLTALTENDRAAIKTANDRMAGEALRVLGFAYHQGEEANGAEAGSELTWLGIAGMADPIRAGIKEAIGDFHRAGIGTVMITGDQSATAYSIGRKLGLSGSEHLDIFDSTHLVDMEPEVLTALSKNMDIFSRVSPAHKLQVVQALQRSGRVVAMTGDGINDSPALKAADIGIAMGHSGTDVAREVADVVLEDDNIETMIVAIGQGRTIYNNIRKSIHFLLSTNLSEILVMFSSISLGLGTPLGTMQLLWINLISDIAPGLALALEPPEPDVLLRRPRSKNEAIIGRSDLKRIFFESATLAGGSLSAYGYGLARYGRGPRASSLAFLSLTGGQILHAVSCRSDRRVFSGSTTLPPNRYLDAAVGGSFALQAIALCLPWTRRLLGITGMGAADWLVAAGGATLPLMLNEATKKGEAQK